MSSKLSTILDQIEDKTSFTLFYDNVFLLKDMTQSFLFLCISWFFHFFISPVQEVIAPIIKTDSILSLSDQYIEKEKTRFLSTFQDENVVFYNMNTDPEFYSVQDYKECLKEKDNALETKWKTRILFETTPRGNLIMQYDPYKRAFVYYSDQHIGSYNVLNAAAMKFVRMFSCRDLFIDENITPIPSPLMKIEEEEEKMTKDLTKEIENEKQKGSEFVSTGIDKEILRKAPFAKFKNYKLEDKSTLDTNNVAEEKKKNQPHVLKICYLNRFLHMGKMCNISLLQKIPVKKVFRNEKTQFDALFAGEHETQKTVLSYKDYKCALEKLTL